jgi:hypothetical protein
VYCISAGECDEASLRYVSELYATGFVVFGEARYRTRFEERILVAAEVLTVADHGARGSF